MWMSLRNSVIQLNANKPVSFRDARGALLKCVEGVLWVTIDGQPGDYFLTAGQSLRIDSQGLAVVEGVPAGAFRLQTAAPWPIRSANRLVQAVHGVWARRPARPRPTTRNTTRTC